MSFTGQDLVDLVEIYTNISVDTDNAPKIVSLGLNRLASLGYAFSGENFTIVSEDIDTYQSFTDDVLGVVLVLNENDTIYNRWQYKEGSGIKFNDVGEYTIILKKIPSTISDLTTDIGLHDIYKTSLSKHLAGFIKLQLNDTSPDGTRLMREFERLSASAYNTLIQANTPSEVRVGQNV
jgi:hypothetical protein